MLIVQVFIIHSQVFKCVVQIFDTKWNPDSVEALPGVVKTKHFIQDSRNTQTIAGGLINTIDEVNEAVKT